MARTLGALLASLGLLATAATSPAATPQQSQSADIVINGPAAPQQSLATTAASVAPQPVTEPHPAARPLRRITDAIMAEVGAGKLKAAYKLIGNYATVPPSDVHKQYAKLAKKRKQRSYAATYGKTIGVAFAGRRELAGDLVELVYIERAQRRPLIWTFYAYRTAVGWGLVSWRCDDDIPGAFERLGR